MAAFAILIWPAIALLIFMNRAIVPAILAATVLPYLFLPEAFEIALPGVPDLDKTAIISVGLMGGLIFFGDWARKRAELPILKCANRWFRFVLLSLVGTLFISSVLTVMNNREILFFGPTVLPALRPWDIIAQIADLIILLAPFFIAHRFLATPDAQRSLLKAFVIFGLMYSFLMLVEFRLSPQLHNWIYGYYQHRFIQHIRDGYRPMVFLEHGLWVGFFIFMAVLGAAALWKAERDAKWLWAAGWLFIILLNSNNLGASALGIFFLGVLIGLWQKAQVRIVAVIALTTLVYPALRQAELIPLEKIISAAASISEERAGSLAFRLQNEDMLLDRAYQKPLTGWGGWSRDRIFDEMGNEISLSEGLWILTIGPKGWIGYAGLFGLLTFPLITLVITARRKEIPPETIGLALICTGNLIYMIPNATLTPIGLLCFGALAGFAQYDSSVAKTRDDIDHGSRSSETRRYTRFSYTSNT